MAKPIKGPHSGPKEALLQFAQTRRSRRMDHVQQFLDELYNQTIFDAFLIGVQSCLETWNWTSVHWNTRLNPGGIGVTSQDMVDAHDFGISYQNGTDAARAMLIRHCAYTKTPVPEAWKPWLLLNTRYEVIMKEYPNLRLTDWSEYGNGKWAEDPQYYQKLLNREKEIRSNYKEADMPTVVNKWLHVGQTDNTGAWWNGVDRRIDGRYGMGPEIIVLHIQDGTSWNSWRHFHNVTASSTVFVNYDGSIWNLVPEADGPWTNGDVQSSSALGWEVMNTFGPDPNVYSLTIETEGFPGEPRPEAQIQSVVWQIRQWMSKYDIPLRYVLRHADINGATRPYCPGDAFYNEVIRRLRDGDVPAKPVYAKPVPVVVQGVNWDGTQNVNVGGALFIGEPRTVKAASAGVYVRQRASLKAPMTRRPLDEDEGFGVLGYTTGEAVNGEDRWWITKSYSRIHVSGTVEKPGDNKPTVPAEQPEKPQDEPEVLPGGAIIVNGGVYYPALLNGAQREIVVTAAKANLRDRASTKSKVVGTTKKGDIHKVAYWCFGEEVRDESVWWIIEPDDGSDAIQNGARLWCAATESRPA